jgi:hypothetical protein
MTAPRTRLPSLSFLTKPIRIQSHSRQSAASICKPTPERKDGYCSPIQRLE